MESRDEPILTLKAMVVDHLQTTLLRQDWQWQPSLSEAVEGLTAAHAAYKPAPERHCIWQIVRHLILWKRAVLQAWDGDPPDGEQLEKDDWQEISGDEAAWQRDLRALLDVSNEYLHRVEGLNDADLSRSLSWYRGSDSIQPLAMRLVRTTTHDIYHAGQIRYLRALQGI